MNAKSATAELQHGFMAKSRLPTVQDELDAMDRENAIINVIARAAADPNVDVDKMERLLEMQERVMARNAKAAYDAALAELQPNLPVISQRGKILNRNSEVQSTYALWEDVNEAIRPLLAEHGFALSFKTGRTADLVTVTGILSHRSGHREETTVELPSDTSGSKNAVQAIGSSTSYGKRYAAFALLNITSKGEDDDGQKGGAAGSITGEQFKALNELADEVGADKQRLCKYLGIPDLRDLPFARFDEAKRAIEAKRGRGHA